MTKLHNFLFDLLRSIFDKDYVCGIPDGINWRDVIKCAKQQRVYNLTFDAVRLLHTEKNQDSVSGLNMDVDTLMEWLYGVTLNENKYNRHIEAIDQLVSVCHSKNIELILLKGHGLSLDYPIPNHRDLGDIDIYSRNNQSIIDEILQENGFKMDKVSPHHSSFHLNGITIENHYSILDLDNHRSNVRLEGILSSWHENLLVPIKIKTVSVNILPHTLNAIYLLRHAGEHFASNEIYIRQIIDIACFFCRHTKEIDWPYVLSIYEKERMQEFYDAIATICIHRLGFCKDAFVGYRDNGKLADKVLEDIFADKGNLVMDASLVKGKLQKLKYGIDKTIRWYNNRWKYRIVYNEGFMESFFTLALNRLRN